MRDTPPDIAQLVRDRYRALSPGERVVMACAMFDTAKALATAGIRASRPNLSDADLRVALFDRFYGREVSTADRQAVIARIRAGR